jgi:hypothetical protein
VIAVRATATLLGAFVWLLIGFAVLAAAGFVLAVLAGWSGLGY